MQKAPPGLCNALKKILSKTHENKYHKTVLNKFELSEQNPFLCTCIAYIQLCVPMNTCSVAGPMTNILCSEGHLRISIINYFRGL
jgi:hypothetical protein